MIFITYLTDYTAMFNGIFRNTVFYKDMPVRQMVSHKSAIAIDDGFPENFGGTQIYSTIISCSLHFNTHITQNTVNIIKHVPTTQVLNII